MLVEMEGSILPTVKVGNTSNFPVQKKFRFFYSGQRYAFAEVAGVVGFRRSWANPDLPGWPRR